MAGCCMASDTEKSQSTTDVRMKGEANSSDPQGCGSVFSCTNVLKDTLYVRGTECDFELTEDDNELMERVWYICKPPAIPPLPPVVSARRIQVMKERLSNTSKKCSILNDNIRDQVEESLKYQKHKRKEHRYVPVTNAEEEMKVSCQEKTQTPISSCARNLMDLLERN